jgi:GH25 family lysozyme M1 (1,4-beta-N-acetylmuramidase)
MKLKGIDVSKHQGKIDWKKVKKDGVDFAMLRMGYGGDDKSQDDPTFEQNVKGCEENGIKWGAYLYSYALDMDDVRSEVKHALRLLKGKKPDFPIAYDMEDADGYKKKKGMPSNAELVNFVDYFCNAMEEVGYYAVVYASRSWLNNQLKSKKLDRYDKWLAEWSEKPTYKGTFNMWQYTDKGSVSGVKGDVDMNIAYSDFDFKKKEPPEPKVKFITYQIKLGDTLTEIAKRYKTTVGQIMDDNRHIKNSNRIFVNQRIKIRK